MSKVYINAKDENEVAELAKECAFHLKKTVKVDGGFLAFDDIGEFNQWDKRNRLN